MRGADGIAADEVFLRSKGWLPHSRTDDGYIWWLDPVDNKEKRGDVAVGIQEQRDSPDLFPDAKGFVQDP